MNMNLGQLYLRFFCIGYCLVLTLLSLIVQTVTYLRSFCVEVIKCLLSHITFDGTVQSLKHTHVSCEHGNSLTSETSIYIYEAK